MVKIAFVNQKGGVSKTASTANLAAIYAGKYSKRVLVADCDAQANLTFYLSGEVNGVDDYAEALIESVKNSTSITNLEDYIVPVQYAWKGRQTDISLSLLPGSSKLDFVYDADINTLSEVLKNVQDDYDICLLDCGPQKMPYNMLAIAAADYVIVPMDPNLVNLHGFTLLNEFVDNVNSLSENKTTVLGAFLTMLDVRATIHQQVITHFKSALGDLLFDTYIRRARAVEESYNVATPLYYYERSQPVCADYIKLADEILERIDR